MIHLIREALIGWRDDPAVEQVLVFSNSPKALCSGGDVREARDGVLDGRLEEVDGFFRNEYLTNGDIAEYPKPFIAVMDGVVMGGGLGISAHGSHRVVTERAFASMPEMNIGYVTDVGVPYMAQRMVGTRGKASPALAKFWGITGYRMYAADMLWSGLATHLIRDPESFITAVIEQGVDAAVDAYALPAPSPAPLEEHIEDIEAVFSHSTWDEITAALEEHPRLKELVTELLSQACPASIIAANELFEAEAQAGTIREALELELNLGRVMIRRPDFAEGVRAVLVDKTQDARFEHASTDEVDPAPFLAALGRA